MGEEIWCYDSTNNRAIISSGRRWIKSFVFSSTGMVWLTLRTHLTTNCGDVVFADRQFRAKNKKNNNDGYKWLLWNPWSYDEIYSGWREEFLLVVWRLDIAVFFAVLPNTRFVFVYPLIIFTLLSSQFGLTKIRAWSGKYWTVVNWGCSW